MQEFPEQSQRQENSGSAGRNLLLLHLGRVVTADAEIDERLFRWLLTLLPTLHHEVVSLLFRSESSESKLRRIRELLKATGTTASEVKVGGLDLSQAFVTLTTLRRRRNQLVHAFYDTELSEDGDLRRFTSRDRTVDTVSLTELDEVAEGLLEVGRHLEALRQSWAYEASRRHDSQFLPLLEEARELLVVQRLMAQSRLEGVAAAFDRGRVRVALRGQGRWRILDDDEHHAEDEILCELHPSVGRLDLYANGQDNPPIVGGDTGWLDVSEQARNFDPDVQEMFIRRVHGEVSASYSSNHPSLAAENPWSLELAPQVFGSSPSFELLTQILSTFEGFSPR